MRNRADSPTKTCTRDGCTKPLRARGLCSTHYNQRDPDRHRMIPTPCEVCGTTVMRAPHSRYRTVCTSRCRSILVWGRPEGATAVTWEDWAPTRARKAGATIVHRVSRDEVGERDGWVCQACHIPTNRDADPLHPDAPTIDHTVPLSKGGQHTMTNLQVLCYSCNSRKQDRIDRALTSNDAGSTSISTNAMHGHAMR